MGALARSGRWVVIGSVLVALTASTPGLTRVPLPTPPGRFRGNPWGSILVAEQHVLGNRFGAVWGTNEGRVMNVGVVHPTRADADYLASITPPSISSRLVPVRYSYQQILDLRDRLATLITHRAPGVLAWVGPDPIQNRVTIGLTRHDAELEALILAAAPPESLEIEAPVPMAIPR